MSRRQLLTETAIYGGTAMARHAVGFFLIPYYTRVFDQASFGGLDLILAGTGLIALILDLQLGPSTTRYFHFAGTGKEEKARYVGGMVVFRAVTAALPALLLGAAFALLGGGGLPLGKEGRLAVVLSILGIPCSLLMEYQFLLFRLMEWRWRFAALSVGGAVAGGVAVVLCVTIFRMGIAGVILGQTLASVGLSLVQLAYLRRELRFQWRPPRLGEHLRYGLPLVPGLLLGWCWVYMNRFLLAMRLPLEEIAVFALAMKVLIFMSFVAAAYRMAWEPLSMKVLSEKGDGARDWYASSFDLQAAGLLLLVALLSVASRPLVAMLAPPSYQDAARLIPFLAFSSAQGFLGSSFNIGNQVACRTWITSGATGIGIIVMALILWLGLELGGLLAAALGMAAGTTVSTIIVYATSQRNFSVPYNTGTLAVFSSCLVAVLCIHSAELSGIISSTVSRVGILTAGAGGTWIILDRQAPGFMRSLRIAIAEGRK